MDEAIRIYLLGSLNYKEKKRIFFVWMFLASHKWNKVSCERLKMQCLQSNVQESRPHVSILKQKWIRFGRPSRYYIYVGLKF